MQGEKVRLILIFSKLSKLFLFSINLFIYYKFFIKVLCTCVFVFHRKIHTLTGHQRTGDPRSERLCSLSPAVCYSRSTENDVFRPPTRRMYRFHDRVCLHHLYKVELTTWKIDKIKTCTEIIIVSLFIRNNIILILLLFRHVLHKKI